MKKPQETRPIVVVLGMHRCGTSLASNLMAAWGVQLGAPLIPGDDFNERGYWEHEKIYEIQDELQRRLDRVWHRPEGSLPLPEGWLERKSVRALEARLLDVVRTELDSTDGLWGFKDPRTASFLPLWHRIFETLQLEPRYLISVRDPRAVVGSLIRRNELSARHTHAVWMRTYLDAVLHTNGSRRAFVDYDRWFQDPETQLLAAGNTLGLDQLGAERVPEVVRQVVHPELRHHGIGVEHDTAPQEPDGNQANVVGLLHEALLQTTRGVPFPDEMSWLDTGFRVSDNSLEYWTQQAAERHHAAPVADVTVEAQSTVVVPQIEPLPKPEAGTESSMKRICIVSSEFIGPHKNGGIGTASTTLGEALADAGHDVTLLYAGGACEHRTFEHWISRYREKGINFTPLPPPEGGKISGPTAAIRPYEVYRWLRDHDDFDVLHFHEMNGLGFFVLTGREQGIAFADTTICVGTHSPHEWLRDANREYMRDPMELEFDFVERRCVELADVVWSPSRYMLEWLHERGWTLPQRCFVQPNILPRSARRGESNASTDAGPIREIVFFGRLEDRKGLVIFCDAIDRLCENAPARFQVTFLGRHARVEGRDSDTWLAERTREWNCRHRVIDDRDQPSAMAYLMEPKRVAVIASPIDNSPCTVAECLGAGIPLLACHTGGIPELIDPEDVERICFPYRVEALEGFLRAALIEGVRPSRPAQDFDECESTWVAWHGALPTREARQAATTPKQRSAVDPLVTICIPHFNRPDFLRQALDSVRAQDYADIEVVLVDDGSTDPEALEVLEALEPEFAREGWTIVRQQNRYLGATRNTAARHSRGEYLLFLDDDNYAKPHAVRSFVAAARATGADVVTCFMDFFSGDGPPVLDVEAEERWLFLGGAALPGIYRNVFGDAFALVRREAFERIGGFSEDRGVTHEDWEFFAKATIGGLRIEVMPSGLFWYRVTPDSMIRSTDVYRNNMRHIRPYTESLPGQLADLVAFSQAQHIQLDRVISALNSVGGLYAEAVRSMLDGLQVLVTPQHGDNAREVMTRCLDLAARSGNPEVMMEALFVAAVVMARIGDPAQARRLATMAVDAANGQNHSVGLARAQQLLGAVEQLATISEPAASPAGQTL